MLLLEGPLVRYLSLPSGPAGSDGPRRRAPAICAPSGSSNSPRWSTDIKIQHKDHFQNTRNSLISVSSIPEHPKLAFDRLPPCDEELYKGQQRSFGQFVVREALTDGEYWTASLLRGEAHWESVSYMRNLESLKRTYAEQEYYALKRRCTERDGNTLKCTCLVTVKEPNVNRTAIDSVVGTLDLSIRRFLHGEIYPGEFKKPPGFLINVHCDRRRYAYIANLCVSKSARRQEIASNMLCLASDIAILSGMKQLFLHVNADNKPAQDLYKKIGFEIVEAASSIFGKDQRLLMCVEF